MITVLSGLINVSWGLLYSYHLVYSCLLGIIYIYICMYILPLTEWELRAPPTCVMDSVKLHWKRSLVGVFTGCWMLNKETDIDTHISIHIYIYSYQRSYTYYRYIYIYIYTYFCLSICIYIGLFTCLSVYSNVQLCIV